MPEAMEGKKNLKNLKDLFFMSFRPVSYPYFTQLFALYATQLKNFLLLQTAYFIKGLIHYHLNCLYF